MGSSPYQGGGHSGGWRGGTDPPQSTGYEAFPAHGAPADADIPGGPDDTYPAAIADWSDPRGAPEWLQHTGELPTVVGADYLDAAREPVREALETFPPHRGRRKTRLLTTATVVAVALLAGVAIFVIRHPGGKAGHTPSPLPAAGASHSAPGARPASSASQGLISTALIFPHARVVADGIRFRRVIAVLDTQCTHAARGAFATALNSAGCQRVVRATYVDSARQYAVTAGVAELPGSAAASRANRSGKFGPDIWFVGLDGPAGSGATTVTRSVGFGYDVVYGRYIIYALATYSNGRNPTGNAEKARMLKTLSRSFTALARHPLLAAGR